MPDDEDEKAEIISFKDASHTHVHVRKEQKLNDMKKAFRSVTKKLLKDKREGARKEKRKRKNRKKKK